MEMGGMGFLEDEIGRIESRKRPRTGLILVFALFLIIVVLLAAGMFILGGIGRDVAVVYIDGVLYTGSNSGGGYAGSEDIGRQIRMAADDRMVQAVVLRINSPGGTPSAAQEIIADIEYAKGRKPVVVSMGEVAASAAYHISAHADRIYATPDTITGSIGTIWVFYDLSDWYESEGIDIEVIKSGDRKDMGSEHRALTPDEHEYAQRIVDESFEELVSDVVKQRNISREYVQDARIIRGSEALHVGLVDEMGNLFEAIEGARALAR
jgi:protease IV